MSIFAYSQPAGLHPTGLHPTGPTGAHQTGHYSTGPHQARTSHRSSNDGQQHGPYPYMPPPMARRPPSHLGPPHPLPPPPPHQPPSSQSSSSNNSESAWERGLRHAKEMIKKASQRKEEEVDFDDKRFNLGIDDEGTSHSRDSHRSHDSPEPTRYDGPSRRISGSRSPVDRIPPYRDRERERRERDQRDRRPNRDDYYDSEYERRRRLAFESAPWNDDQSPPPPRNRPPANRPPQRSREGAEMYRDPWRRSKSPPPKWSAPTRRLASSTTSKKSHSMSSISATDSGSDLSGSDSFSGSDSLSDSEGSFSHASDVSGNAPRQLDRKSAQSRKNRPPAVDHGRSASSSVSHSGSDRNSANSPKRGAAIRNRVPPPSNKPNRSSLEDDAVPSGQKRKDKKLAPPPATVSKRRDSWSDSSSESSQSDSSQFSGSDSESGSDDAFSQGESDEVIRNRHPKSGNNQRTKPQSKPNIRSPPSTEGSRKNVRARGNHSPQAEPSAKKLKSSSSSSKVYLGNRDDDHSPGKGSPSSYDKSISSPSSETPQKKLIKMTFKKKVSS